MEHVHVVPGSTHTHESFPFLSINLMIINKEMKIGEFLMKIYRSIFFSFQQFKVK